MATGIRWLVVVLLVVHGLLHLVGAAKGLGLAPVDQLREPIPPTLGLVWASAAAAVLTAAVMIALRSPSWWWIVAGAAAALSQMMILLSWSDAKAGTVLNVVLVLAAVLGFASTGPGSYAAQWGQRVEAAVAAAPESSGVVTEADLSGLPPPLATYLRRSGAVGQPRVTAFRATLHGRIRSGPGEPWMPFTARQVNTFGPDPQRLFLMHATKAGVPVTVFHDYHDATATMRGKVLSLVPVLDASGPEMDKGETVTVFNDMAVFAPAALVDAPVTWTQLAAHRVRGTLTNAGQTVSAELVFDAAGDLVDFVSDDRLAASADGSTFTAQRWSTPLSRYAEHAGRRVVSDGEGRWHAPEPAGTFSYIELHLDNISYNGGVAAAGTNAGPTSLTRSAPAGRRLTVLDQ